MTFRSLATPIAAVAIAAAVAACSGGAAAGVSPPPETDVTVTARSGTFEPTEARIPAGTPFELFFRNLDPAPHNVAVYTDPSAATDLFVGDVVTDAATLYRVPALETGEYFFRCDVHPDMTGNFIAEG